MPPRAMTHESPFTHRSTTTSPLRYCRQTLTGHFHTSTKSRGPRGELCVWWG